MENRKETLGPFYVYVRIYILNTKWREPLSVNLCLDDRKGHPLDFRTYLAKINRCWFLVHSDSSPVVNEPSRFGWLSNRGAHVLKLFTFFQPSTVIILGCFACHAGFSPALHPTKSPHTGLSRTTLSRARERERERPAALSP